MARRRLEAAIQAGQCIAKGKDFPEKFCRISVDHEIKLEREVGGAYSLQYSFDGKFLALGCGNGTIRLYDTATGRKVSDIRKSRYGGYPIMVLRFHPKNPNIIYAGTSEGQVLSCDISDFTKEGQTDYSNIESDKDERWTEIITEKKQDGKKMVKNEINCMDFDYTYTRFATSGKDLSVRLYDSTTNELIREYTGYDNTKDPTNIQSTGAGARVFALKFHPEFDDIFLTGGWDRHLKIWDSRAVNEAVKRTIHGPHLCGDALDIKGYEILTGSYTGKDAVQIWNYSTDYSTNSQSAKPKVVNFPCGKEGPFIYAAQFCDNDIVIAGGSGTHSACAVNTKTDEVIGEVKMGKTVQAIDTVMGGRLFAVGDGGDCLKMCSLK